MLEVNEFHAVPDYKVRISIENQDLVNVVIDRKQCRGIFIRSGGRLCVSPRELHFSNMYFTVNTYIFLKVVFICI